MTAAPTYLLLLLIVQLKKRKKDYLLNRQRLVFVSVVGSFILYYPLFPFSYDTHSMHSTRKLTHPTT